MVHPVLKQVYMSFGLWCQQYQLAFVCGIQSIMIIQLRKSDSPIKLTSDQESWIASVMFLMMFPSNTLAGMLTPKFGRKYIFLLFVIPNAMSLFFIYFATDYYTLLSCFIMAGLSGGAAGLSSIIIAECCSPRIRGTLMDLKYTTAFFGVAAARLLSNFFNWRTITLINGLPIAFSIAICLSSPESPAWLASQGRFEECKAAYIWYRSDKEPDELKNLIDWQKKELAKRRLLKKSNIIIKVKNTLQDKSFLKSTFIAFFCTIFYDVCGKQSLISYMDIVNAITKDPDNGNFYSLTLDFSDFIGLCLSTVAVTKIKRRRMLFSIGVPSILWLYAFCGVSYLSSINYLPETLSWLPFTMIVIYFFSISTGALSILNTVQGEIYPLQYRGVGIVLNSVAFGLSTFVLTKTTPALFRTLGLHGLFLLFAVGLSLVLFCLNYTLPETFNKTLQTIEAELIDVKMTKNTSYDSEMNENMLSR